MTNFNNQHQAADLKLLTSSEHQVSLHSLQAEGFNSAAHHGVPH